MSMTDKNSSPSFEGMVCPIPLRHDEQIIMGHGSGGGLTDRLIREVFMPYLGSPALQEGNDFAGVKLGENASSIRVAVSTDAHVITPLFYPGGDIGRLAVCGTVNDVSMSGAVPQYMSASFILEEGLPVETLVKVLESMRDAALEAGVQIIAGDTKVVEKGKADGLYITTTGVGLIPKGVRISGSQAKAGDAVLISGTLGDHGIAVLTARGGLGLESKVQSDQAPLNGLIQDCLKAAPHIHVLRDPTRGGLATTLNEIARQSQVGIQLEEETIPVRPEVTAVCELLGFDPLYVANEGKVIIILPEEEAPAALDALHSHPYGRDARRIGAVTEQPAGRVLLQTALGTRRILDVMMGEMLPRIC
jgi:hydrogenase expression/formation protein HypE